MKVSRNLFVFLFVLSFIVRERGLASQSTIYSVFCFKTPFSRKSDLKIYVGFIVSSYSCLISTNVYTFLKFLNGDSLKESFSDLLDDVTLDPHLVPLLLPSLSFPFPLGILYPLPSRVLLLIRRLVCLSCVPVGLSLLSLTYGLLRPVSPLTLSLQYF